MPQRDQSPLTAVEAWKATPASRIWVGGNNTDARREIETLVAAAERPPTGELDRAFIAPLSTDEAVYFARKLRSRLTGDSSIWIVYPKRSGRLRSDVGEPDVRQSGLELGLVDYKICAVDADWTGMKFARRKK